MESAQAPIVQDRISFISTVKAIEERHTSKYVSGVGKEAVFQEVSLGWYVWLEGSFESIHVGMSKPNWKIGDKIRVVMEKMNALPSQPPV